MTSHDMASFLWSIRVLTMKKCVQFVFYNNKQGKQGKSIRKLTFSAAQTKWFWTLKPLCVTSFLWSTLALTIVLNQSVYENLRSYCKIWVSLSWLIKYMWVYNLWVVVQINILSFKVTRIYRQPGWLWTLWWLWTNFQPILQS